MATKKQTKKSTSKKAAKKAVTSSGGKMTTGKSKKTSVGKKPGKKKSSAKSSAKKAAKKLTKKAARRTQSVKKAAKKTAKKVVKKASGVVKAAKKTAKKVAKKAPSSGKATQRTTKKRASSSGGGTTPLEGNQSPAALSNSGVKIGDQAKEFSLLDQDGAPISSADLRGKPYVLYFYPKDNTPGCTQEACDFRDDHSAFERAGVEVFGVSPDSVGSHSGFVARHELPFRLISDPDKQLAQAYGVWAKKKNYGREYMGIVRSTFLIDQKGKVRGIWDQVKVKGHVQAVLAKIGQELSAS